MAWLDLRNAFGNISHEAIYVTLQHMGISDDMIALIRDIYIDTTTTIKTSANDETDPINIMADVQWRRQGGARGGKCPPKIIFCPPILPPQSS